MVSLSRKSSRILGIFRSIDIKFLKLNLFFDRDTAKKLKPCNSKYLQIELPIKPFAPVTTIF
jgi:hypothetical protein